MWKSMFEQTPPATTQKKGIECSKDEYGGENTAKRVVVFAHPPCRRLDPPYSDGRPAPATKGWPHALSKAPYIVDTYI